jgi:hypothetical protein
MQVSEAKTTDTLIQSQGSLVHTMLRILRDKPRLLQNHAEDFFVADHDRMKADAQSSDEPTHYILAIRPCGTHLFEVGESPGEGNSMSGAVLDREADRSEKRSHDWYLVEVTPEDEFFQGSQVYGHVHELDGHEDARRILVENCS